MRISQIRLLTAIVTAIAFWCGPAAAHEQPVTTPAARFVQDTLDHALILVRPPVSAEAGINLTALIRSAMDWPALTRFAVGRYVFDLDAKGMGGATGMLEGQMQSLARRAGGWPHSLRMRRSTPFARGCARAISTARPPCSSRGSSRRRRRDSSRAR